MYDASIVQQIHHDWLEIFVKKPPKKHRFSKGSSLLLTEIRKKDQLKD